MAEEIKKFCDIYETEQDIYGFRKIKDSDLCYPCFKVVKNFTEKKQIKEYFTKEYKRDIFLIGFLIGNICMGLLMLIITLTGGYC